MDEIEQLQKSWRDSARFRGVIANVTLEDDGLVLGAKTVLAKRDSDGALVLDGNETRLFTLLAVAYGQPVSPSILRTFRRASKHARAGDKARAAMDIALARFPKLRDPVDAARRLFIADGLISKGVSPRDIWRALEFDSAHLDELEKLYNQNEPRNPKGDGNISGEWTASGEAAEGAVRTAARRLMGVAARLAGDVVPVVGELLSMTTEALPYPEGGAIPGRPDLRYSWKPDENILYVYRGDDPYPVLQARPYADEFRDPRDRKIARLTETGIQFELKGLPPEWPSPEEQEDRPQKCPIPGPDKPGRGGAQGERDRQYEDQVKATINVPPTPVGIGFWMMDPVDDRPVVVDDCQRHTGMLVEIKGHYTGFMATEWGRQIMGIDWAYQATRQWESSGGRPIEWHFADREAADYGRTIFSERKWLKGIRVVWTPWIGSSK